MKSVCLFVIGASLLICAQSASVSLSDVETRDLEELQRLLDSERTSRHHGGGGSGGSGGSGSGGGGGRRKLEELATILTLCFDYEINNGGSGSGSGSGFDLMFTVTDAPSLFYFMEGCIDYFMSYNSSDSGSGGTVSATSGSGSGMVARELAFHSYLSSRGNSGPHPPPGSGSGLPPPGSGSGSGMTQRALFQLIDRYLAEKGLGGTGSGSGHPPPPGSPPPAKKRGVEFWEKLMKELE